MKELYKPGTDNLSAGKYQEVGPRGGKVQGGNTATIKTGRRLPPTSKSGNLWKKTV